MNENNDLAALTADIVSAYVANNPLPPANLPETIKDVHAALLKLGSAQEAADADDNRVPAVSIRRSVKDDALTCLECGKSFKSLKRHLRTHHDLTPEDYRERWKLAADYPMVSPEYSKSRAEMAKRIGLGRKPAK